MGDELCLATLKFLNEGLFENSINYTHIVLIPKIKKIYIYILMTSDFRPINLCNVVYKIMSKALAH